MFPEAIWVQNECSEVLILPDKTFCVKEPNFWVGKGFGTDCFQLKSIKPNIWLQIPYWKTLGKAFGFFTLIQFPRLLLPSLIVVASILPWVMSGDGLALSKATTFSLSSLFSPVLGMLLISPCTLCWCQACSGMRCSTMAPVLSNPLRNQSRSVQATM